MTADEMGESLSVLHYAMLFWEHDRLDEFLSVNPDELYESDPYETFFNCIGLTAGFVCENYVEDYDYNRWYFSDPCMLEYYRLCRNYGSLHRQKLKDNPYMKEAENFVDMALTFSSGGCGYWLLTKVNHACASGIVFCTDENYFGGELELIDGLLNIMAWYRDGCVRLSKKIESEKISAFPILRSEMVVAA